MDLRQRAGQYLRDDRRRPAERHARRSAARSRTIRSGSSSAYVRSMSGQLREGRRARPQRPHDGKAAGILDRAAAAERRRRAALGDVAAMTRLLGVGAGLGRRDRPVPAIAAAGMQSALDPAGPQAARIGGLWWLIFGVCTAVYVLVMGGLAAALWRRHRPRTRRPTEPRARAADRRRRGQLRRRHRGDPARLPGRELFGRQRAVHRPRQARRFRSK